MLAELVHRLVQTGCIKENKLNIVNVSYACDTRSRGLRLTCDRSYLLADNGSKAKTFLHWYVLR